MTTQSIHDLSDVLGDEGLMTNRNGHREVSSPNFCFFDDEREQGEAAELTRWGRELALDVEEYVAKRNHEEALDNREEELVRVRKVRVEPAPKVELKPTKEGVLPFIIDPREQKRLSLLSRGLTKAPKPLIGRKAISQKLGQAIEKTGMTPAGYHLEIKPCKSGRFNKYFLVSQTMPPETTSYRSIEDDFEAQPDESVQEYNERMEAKRAALWLIAFHKRRPETNDKWHKALRTLSGLLEDEDDQYGPTVVKTLKKTLQGRVKYAPGPISGTVFKNPDGSRHVTTGTSPGSAKAKFISTHKLEESFVSVDRVQYENERTSRYVVGVRRASDGTPSRYYDPNPAWKDVEGGTYAPCACALFAIPASMVLPVDSHRLTVREFEQAIIAGASCFDNEDEALAGSMESDFMADGADTFETFSDEFTAEERSYDGRGDQMDVGYGRCTRMKQSLTDEELYLYGICGMIQDAQAQELILLEHQEPNMLHRHFMSSGTYNESVVSLIQFVAQDDPGYLDYVTRAICGDDALIENQKVSDMEQTICTFGDYEDAIHTGPTGRRIPAYHKWA